MRTRQATAGHAAGIYSDATLDGPEIGTLVVVVDRAKNLPNRRAIGKQDPYCAMRLAKDAKKTKTDRRGGQTPKWDQELRFTVHDSPDYYKLKVSIFNDDKKTDLIGEAWMDLANVIKLGGGQADVWQQLSFKGKYAGDVRVELTFYDTREQPQEKRRAKDSSHAEAEYPNGDISLPSQRSLGPREIKRRPLPANPAATSSPAQISGLPEPMEIPPLRPPKEPLNDQPQVHAPVALRPRTASASPQPDPTYDQYYPNPEQEQLQGYNYPSYESQSFEEPNYQFGQLASNAPRSSLPQLLSQQHYDVQDGYEQDDYHSYDAPSELAHSHDMELWQGDRPPPMHMRSEPVTPQHNMYPVRPSPLTNNSDSQVQRYLPQPHPSVVSGGQPRSAHNDYRQRRSWAHYDTPQSPLENVRTAPPVPPKHKETPPEQRTVNDCASSTYTPQPLRVNQRRAIVTERSPLQSLEDVYDRGQDDWHDRRSAQRHTMYGAPMGFSDYHRNQQMQLYDNKRRHETLPLNTEYRAQSQDQADHYRRNSYNPRQPNYGQYMTTEPAPEASRSNEAEVSDYIAARQPTVQDAPPSPGLSPALARKAVGDQPRRLSAAPFGPDSYDVLNPSSSPVTNEGTPFQTPEQAKEAARFREVQKMRDVGPIIGNDGREIDPSDHLPSDTWAPEPEYKNKKPEHVVHIRSKNSPNRPSGARASPLVIRHNHHTTSSQSTPASTAPAVAHTPNNTGSRAKLQKPISARPLPTQPYSSPSTSAHTRSATASSPALVSSPNHVHFDDSPHYQQNLPHVPRLSFDNRSADQRTRPALSEYQVAIGNPTHSRGPSYNHNTTTQSTDNSPYVTPTKYGSRPVQSSPHHRTPYGSQYESDIPSTRSTPRSQQEPRPYFDDPLAAEMSLIDIGPSRTDYRQGNMSMSLVRSRGVH